MVPKWSPNLSKIDPGGVLGNLGNHPWSKLPPRPNFWWFWLLFGTPPFGTRWGSFWTSFFQCVLFLLGGLLMALASIWAPQTLPKRDPKGGQSQQLEIQDFVLFITLAPYSRVLKIIFVADLLEPLLEPILWFWLTLGVPFGDHFVDSLETVFCVDF